MAKELVFSGKKEKWLLNLEGSLQLLSLNLSKCSLHGLTCQKYFSFCTVKKGCFLTWSMYLISPSVYHVK